MSKESAAYNVIIRTVELEKEEFSWLKGSECCFSGWLPEVDFVWGRSRR
jgi:hypothetical protein